MLKSKKYEEFKKKKIAAPRRHKALTVRVPVRLPLKPNGNVGSVRTPASREGVMGVDFQTLCRFQVQKMENIYPKATQGDERG
jgi:hypothetical protein